MKVQILAVGLAMCLVSPGFAQSNGELDQLSTAVFEGMDNGGKGYLNNGDLLGMRADVFASMDYNEDEKLTLDEWTGWGFGFSNLAEDLGRVQAFEAARQIAFDLYDRDKDGAISVAEHKYGVAAEFRRADLNGDAKLSEKEFIGGFSILVAIRSALMPRS